MANTINIGNIEASAIMIGSSAVSAVYIGSDKIYPSGPPDYSRKYLTFEVVEPGTVTITASNSTVSKTIQYSLDNGSTWTSLTTSTTAQQLGVTLSVGDKVLVKGTNTTYGASGGIYNNFGGTAKVNVYGNVMSLISGDNFASSKTLSANYTFNYLFTQYTNLLSAENLVLPATTLTTGCYDHMFIGCINLTTAPELPATTLANSCYNSMFSGCTSLTTAPELTATTLHNYCYAGMFYGCTALINAPQLPAITLATSCYSSMFQGCTSLVAAPELTATELATSCYYTMFRGCTSLVAAPVLPAATLVNYCYESMFYGCTSLNYIKCLATDISATDCTKNWVFRVASTGTFVKDVSMSNWTTGLRGIPSGWTVQDDGAAPTDNWVLVDDQFTSPRKIKVDYSLIEDDNSSVRTDYELSFQSEYYMVVYLNATTIQYFIDEYGWDNEQMMEYLDMVVVLDSNFDIVEILEDSVEYSTVGAYYISDCDYILPTISTTDYYLYATV